MCFDPVTMAVLTFATQAVTQVVQYAGAAQESKATDEAARAAYNSDQIQLTRRQIQEQDAASQKAQDITKDEAQKSSEVALSAGSAGVSGVSVENLVADVHRRASSARVNQFANTQAALNQLQMEKTGARNTAQSRINSAPMPSALGLIAGITGSGLSSYAGYQKQLQYADEG